MAREQMAEKSHRAAQKGVRKIFTLLGGMAGNVLLQVLKEERHLSRAKFVDHQGR